MISKKLTNVKSGLANNSDRCIHCNAVLRINDDETGEIICGNCGHVISERVANSEYETRMFANDLNKQRTGSSITLAKHDMGLSTVINSADIDARGNTLSPIMKSTLKRLRMWQRQTGKNTDKIMQNAFGDLERASSKLAVSDAVVEKAAHICRKIVERRMTKGRSTSTFAIASLYTACRISGIPRTIKDVQRASGVSRRSLTRYYRLLIKELDLQIPLVDPIQCVTRIANKAGVSERSRRLAIAILEKAKLHGLMDGKDPTSSAATAIYIACKNLNEVSSLRRIATCANVTELTIRNGRKRFQIVDET